MLLYGGGGALDSLSMCQLMYTEQVLGLVKKRKKKRTNNINAVLMATAGSNVVSLLLQLQSIDTV